MLPIAALLLMVLNWNTAHSKEVFRAPVGKSVLLPCPCPNRSLTEEVAWWLKKSRRPLTVFTYEPTKTLNTTHPVEHTITVGDRYDGRIQFFLTKDKDNCSLFLSNINEDDHGRYGCSYFNPSFIRREIILTEPDDMRLVEGGSLCTGRLEMKHQGEWRPVCDESFSWKPTSAAVVCRQLSCGSVVSIRNNITAPQPVWIFSPHCKGSESTLMNCKSGEARDNFGSLTSDVKCSEFVRLVNGSSLCSGRVEVKSNESSWAPICEADFDTQDAEVVCRELGCGAPSALQGALYGEAEAPVWTKELRCEGNESRLLDCCTSGSARNNCSWGKAVGLTCSEPDDVRLVGGGSRCAGRLEMKHQGEWRPAGAHWGPDWSLVSADVMCRQLGCGSAVSAKQIHGSTHRPVWVLPSDCDGSESALRECVRVGSQMNHSTSIVGVCSDLLFQPIITSSVLLNGISEGQQHGMQLFRGYNFTISCSIKPQYPGGSFSLTFTGFNTTHNHTQPAVNHSANFLFPAANDAHQGNYRCIYHLDVFSHNFSSESEATLSLTVTASSLPAAVIRNVFIVALLTLVMSSTAIYFHCKDTRGQKPGTEENMDLVYYNLAGSRPEARPRAESTVSD